MDILVKNGSLKPKQNHGIIPYMYIKQVRALSDIFFKEYGHPPRMFIQTFGCQMNDRESEKLHGLLLAMGYAEGKSEEEADLVLYNTCCVREAAENKVYGKLGYLKAYKASMPGKIIVFCGCMPQRKEVMAEINRHHRHIDIIFGTFNKHHFPRLLYEYLQHRKPVIEILEDYPEAASDEYNGQAARFLPHKAGIVVMHGCDNYCSYCIVPYVRGREVSRKPEEVMAEIKALVSDGVKEIMLLGQNVNSYAYGFAELIKRVNDTPGLKRIRFMTSHPKDLSQNLIDAIRDCDLVCKHIHLPMQAGSDKILKAMNRGYTKAQYLDLTARLRRDVPGIAITTDIIVGFPGEDEEDFEHTLDAVRKSGFAGAFTFLYSHRDGTPAANLTCEVAREAAKNRFDRLVKLLNPMQLAHNKRYLGRKVLVMADKDSSGRTGDNVPVHFEADKNIIPGDMVEVSIEECKTFYIKGKLVPAP